ncbi:MAG: hypothetical protein WCC66_07725 [Rhizobiaceae bacterium]
MGEPAFQLGIGQITPAARLNPFKLFKELYLRVKEHWAGSPSSQKSDSILGVATVVIHETAKMTASTQTSSLAQSLKVVLTVIPFAAKSG